MDGQLTGFITKEEEFHLHIYRQSTLVKASLLKRQPAGQLKRMRSLTSYLVSQSRILPNHKAGHVFSLTRQVVSAFFRTYIYCDYSPCFTDLALLTVVGFLKTVKLLVKYHARMQPLTSSLVRQIACLSDQITKLVTCFHGPGRLELRSSELTSTVTPVPALQTWLCCR